MPEFVSGIGVLNFYSHSPWEVNELPDRLKRITLSAIDNLPEVVNSSRRFWYTFGTYSGFNMVDGQGIFMRYQFYILLAASLIAGCSGDKSNSYSIDESAVGGLSGSSGASGTGVKVGIGDVESNMRLYVLLDESSYSDTIIHNEEFTKREWIARASIDVASPYPSKLNLMIFNRNIKNYVGHAYRTTVNLYMEEKIIHSFKYIAGRNALTNFKEHPVDVMPVLDPEPGKSILFHVRAEIEFFPNTEEESITLESTVPAEATATKMGNPLTLTFAP